MIENDLVEAIIALPENMFYNTGIGTYIWILSNKKEKRLKGKIQLIDATAMKSPLRKNLGKKNCEFTPELRAEILRIFLAYEESDVSKIFEGKEFGFWSVTVERPLRLRIERERTLPAGLFGTAEERAAYQRALDTAPLDDWTAFAKATGLKPALLKKLRPHITVKDPAAQPVAGEADSALRDTENVPLNYPGGIAAFIENEVRPYAPDAYIDEKKTEIGYEISFTKYFYRPLELRKIDEIVHDIRVVEDASNRLLNAVLNY